MKRIKILLATSLTIIGFVIFAWFLLRGFLIENFISSKSFIDLNRAAQVGDFIGGLVGTIFTLVGILLLYETLSLQRTEFTESRRVFIKQQFDNTFFELLKLYQENLKNCRDYNLLGEQIQGKEFFDHNKQQLQYKFLPLRTLSRNRKLAVQEFEKIYVNYVHYFSTYFRTLYRLYSLIDNSEIDEMDKAAYSKILRAQLSESELFFIRYNAMTEQGFNSSFYINKYNILKHLSNFELLEFKYWWDKMDDYERNGLGTLFKEVKSTLKILMIDKKNESLKRLFKKGRYEIHVLSSCKDNFGISLIKNEDKNSREMAITDGFEKLTIEETENLLKCILKELIVSSNFNKYNNRRDLDFYYDLKKEKNINYITVGVKNKKKESLRIEFWS